MACINLSLEIGVFKNRIVSQLFVNVTFDLPITPFFAQTPGAGGTTVIPADITVNPVRNTQIMAGEGQARVFRDLGLKEIYE